MPKIFLCCSLQSPRPDRVMLAEVADESRQQQIGIHHPEHQHLEHQGRNQPAHIHQIDDSPRTGMPSMGHTTNNTLVTTT